MNSDSDSDDEELVNEFNVAIGNANAIALELTQQIEHPINWR
jgi:hypothetical protein